MNDDPDDFFEADEPIAELLEALRVGEPCVTAPTSSDEPLADGATVEIVGADYYVVTMSTTSVGGHVFLNPQLVTLGSPWTDLASANAEIVPDQAQIVGGARA